MKTIIFVQDAQQNLKKFNHDGYERWTVAKPEGITIWHRVKMALACLTGRAFSCHWE